MRRRCAAAAGFAVSANGLLLRPRSEPGSQTRVTAEVVAELRAGK